MGFKVLTLSCLTRQSALQSIDNNSQEPPVEFNPASVVAYV